MTSDKQGPLARCGCRRPRLAPPPPPWSTGRSTPPRRRAGPGPRRTPWAGRGVAAGRRRRFHARSRSCGWTRSPRAVHMGVFFVEEGVSYGGKQTRPSLSCLPRDPPVSPFSKRRPRQTDSQSETQVTTTCLEVLDALVAVHDEAQRGELARPVGDGPVVAHAVEPVLQLVRLEAVLHCW